MFILADVEEERWQEKKEGGQMILPAFTRPALFDRTVFRLLNYRKWT
jgi:hypothetical protein